MPSITANEVDFYYDLQGEGEPVVLISGYAADHESWVPIYDNLVQHHQVLIFDNRGVGETKDNGEAITAELMAKDVMALTTALKLKKPHIVGSSMGGTVAQMIALNYPNEIRKIALLNSAAKWPQATLQACAALLKLRETGVNPALYAEMLLSWLFGDAFLASSSMRRGFIENVIDTFDAQTFQDQARQYQALVTFDIEGKLSGITADTLIVSGSQDLIAPRRSAELLKKRIPNSRLQNIDCGHGVVFEKPQELSKVLLGFLAD